MLLWGHHQACNYRVMTIFLEETPDMCINYWPESVFCLPREKEEEVLPTLIHHWDPCLIFP